MSSSSSLTVAGLVLDGSLAIPKLTHTEDLVAAIDWLGAYEPEEIDDPMAKSVAATAAFLCREVLRREEEAYMRKVLLEVARQGTFEMSHRASAALRKRAKQWASDQINGVTNWVRKGLAL